MITLEQYVGPHEDSPDWTEERQANAAKLLEAVGSLMEEMEGEGIVFPINPHTGTQVSGQTFGGFRPQNCPQGASNSSHKTGQAVDLYDPGEHIDNWLFKHTDRLGEYDLYIEHPSATVGWSHWTTRAPGSGHTVFFP